MRRATRVSLAALLGSLALVPVGAPASYAEGEDPCDKGLIAESERTADTKARTSPPLERMHVPEAQEVTRGRGVTVAVVDSGVGAGLGIDVVSSQRVPGLVQPTLLSGHGTIVAGLIAGEDGVAPDARIISMQVLDKDDPDPQRGERGVSSALIAEGIDRLVDQYATNPFDVVNISLAVRADDPVLARAVKRLVQRDVVVVAASGNVSTDDDSPEPPTSDADVFPADHPGVLTVNAIGDSTVADVRGAVLPNAETDVAAPTAGGLSVNLNGQRCQIGAEVATSYAAAEVSGVVALLRARFPKESARQVVARLVRTAEGAEGTDNPWTGAGVVQAADALTRVLEPTKKGRTAVTASETGLDAQAPPAPERVDAYGPSRTMLMWFALAAGSLLALALMVRPLFRRTTSG